METIWHHVLEKELEVIPSDHPILMADPLSNRNSARERTAQIVFESFNSPAFCTIPSAVLSLHASGRNTGLVIDSGSEVTDIVPIHNGSIIQDACDRFDIAGDDLTDYLRKQLTDAGYEILTNTGSDIVRDMKEKFGYVALDYEEEMLFTLQSSHSAKAYELPDGQVILVGVERLATTECLFQPCMLGLDSRPLQASVYRSIMKSDEGIQNDLFENIVLSGGNTLFRDLPERLQKEIADFDSNKHNTSVIAPPHRKYLAWIGGSMLASQAGFQNWVSKEEYEEVGPSIIHRCI
ncbi:hypothetical protein ASPWEDRAFT_40736 [Aspergillus wentii DTO 134E9]|uniref:Centractin n=1 Tax=Aspergillus wentii DTO 134E9 TaxID=1073089 RepID=A0A1L9RKS3_ASPWE|nr:uncharacterized protein ASPWEDRAFT_40736 [Aspergillus wentii DTO 134E9]OJJ35531.1 hypothetical protein ASPWEDRAFT_40736 [Aspergillus wentii DTO 134E9]